jgi:hypothetical protein
MFFFSNTIFTRRFWISYLPTYISFFKVQFNINLVVIKLNWVKLELKLVELEFKSNQIQFKLHCKVVYASISYKNELIFFISRTFEFFSYSTRMNCLFLVFSILIILVQIRIIYYMLHIASYHHYPLVEIIMSRLFRQHMFICQCHVNDIWTCVV